MSRKYYSKRVGSRAGERHDIYMLRDLLKIAHERLEREGFFQEAFGYMCVDERGRVPGLLGENVAGEVFRLTVNPRLDWHPHQGFFHDDYALDEEDLFDIIEFLFDHVSEPDRETGWDHTSFNDCGWHFKDFRREPGRDRFLGEINPVLEEYGSGYRLTKEGEIEEVGDPGLDTLLDAPLPSNAPGGVAKRVDEAIRLFRRYRSSGEDRRHAVRELAGVLEYLRPEARKVLRGSDEQDLFNIANNFDIRHSNPNQKIDYDQPIWHRWMFYYYLATIHACLRLIEK